VRAATGESRLDEFLLALQEATGSDAHGSDASFSARCPAHDDRQPSLSVAEGGDGRVIVYCHAGCELESICHSVGWEQSDLFPEGASSGPSQPTAVYSFCDENGDVLYQEVRMPPKRFLMRRPTETGGDSWTWDLRGVRRVPYRLPDLRRAREAGKTVMFVEGPKDADRLVSEGFDATTVVGGAKGWRPEYVDYLRDVNLVICADHDEPGWQFVHTIAEAMRGKAASVKVLDLFTDSPIEAKHGLDVSDWFDRGGSAGVLQSIIAMTPEWQAPGPDPEPVTSLLKFVDIGALMLDPPVVPVADVLLRN
jgi:putative DNA primase/helicase